MDTEQEVNPASEWRWYCGFAPSIGWDMAFQASPGLVGQLLSESAPDRIKVRRVSRLEVVKDEHGNPLMVCVPWAPKHFSAIGADSVGVISRGLFLWVKEASPGASEDWDKQWAEQGQLLVLNEQQAAQATEALAREAQAKMKLTQHLKNPHLQKIK